MRQTYDNVDGVKSEKEDGRNAIEMSPYLNVVDMFLFVNKVLCLLRTTYPMNNINAACSYTA